MYTFGLTDNHDWVQAGPPEPELGQPKLIPTPGKVAQGSSDSKSRAEPPGFLEDLEASRWKCFEGVQENLSLKINSTSTFKASRIPQ